MDNTADNSGMDGHSSDVEEDRRDFLALTAGAMGVVGVGCCAVPFLDTLNPAADTKALATLEVDVSDVQEGQAKTVTWRGKPVFIRHRTPDEIKAAREEDLTDLRHPETDEERVQKEKWLVVIGICTHLGCVPTGQKDTDTKGEYDGWFCPCHGSHYDESGRIRKGPAPRNLDVPPYEFLSDTVIKIG